MTSAECDAADAALGLRASGSAAAGEHVRGVDQFMNSEPGGCYQFSGKYHLNLAPNGVGVASGGTHLYCKQTVCETETETEKSSIPIQCVAFCPTGTCDTRDDGAKPECLACKQCIESSMDDQLISKSSMDLVHSVSDADSVISPDCPTCFTSLQTSVATFGQLSMYAQGGMTSECSLLSNYVSADEETKRGAMPEGCDSCVDSWQWKCELGDNIVPVPVVPAPVVPAPVVPTCVHEDCQEWDCDKWCECFDGTVMSCVLLFFLIVLPAIAH